MCPNEQGQFRFAALSTSAAAILTNMLNADGSSVASGLSDVEELIAAERSTFASVSRSRLARSAPPYRCDPRLAAMGLSRSRPRRRNTRPPWHEQQLDTSSVQGQAVGTPACQTRGVCVAALRAAVGARTRQLTACTCGCHCVAVGHGKSGIRKTAWSCTAAGASRAGPRDGRRGLWRRRQRRGAARRRRRC